MKLDVAREVAYIIALFVITLGVIFSPDGIVGSVLIASGLLFIIFTLRGEISEMKGEFKVLSEFAKDSIRRKSSRRK